MLFLVFILPLTTVIALEDSCKNLQIYGSTDIEGVKPPAGRVFFSQTGGSSCLDHYACYNRLGFSYTATSKKYWDNFFIGGNGKVYTGTGWEGKNLRYNGFEYDLSIVFIGDFSDKPLPKIMADTAKQLIECGKDEDYIQHYYSIYTANDFECNLNEVLVNGIDEEVQSWPRYAAGGPINNC
uniref:Peptidoglycan recognition protein family domain-containing protein n=1 Tax=Strigamia maritima TaxID=126957 RepID=T1JLZ0_STRMM